MLVEVLRYGAAGLANTVAGYATFLIAYHLGAAALVANAISYAIGLTVAYLLNLRFVFRGARHTRGAAARFVGSAAIAYAANLVLMSGALTAGLRAEWAQLVGMATYTVIFYVLNKYVVWKAS